VPAVKKNIYCKDYSTANMQQLIEDFGADAGQF
jgi:hypothetical protein